MIATPFHPATLELLRLQSRGRRRRLWQRLRQKRRLALSLVAATLAVVWLGNAAMTVWLRESASPDTLRSLLSWGFVLYATWHLAKAAFFRPEHPFEWSDAERETLSTVPLRPRDLVGYQLASVTVTTVVKAALFTLLLLPDLRSVPVAVVGVLLAMLYLELLRMAVDVVAWGLPRRVYLAYRTVVVAGLVAGGLAIGWTIARSDAFRGRIELGDGVLDRFLTILTSLDSTTIGYAALPFRPLVDLIAADSITAANLSLAAGASALLVLLAVGVVAIYGVVARWVVEREHRDYSLHMAQPRAPGESLATTLSSLPPTLARIARLGGGGPLAWRQMVGARRQWGSVLTAMIAPAILACAPCFIIAEPNIAFLSTAGALAFYTFLLLPTALRFDFRRDLERLAVLKGLPISPAAAVIGQTIAPVLIASAFQAMVLAFAVVARSLPLYYLTGTVLVLLPLNVLVFALDNLIYLLYPYRIQQEGLEVFLRTMLTFTGKGLLFTLGLVLMSGWGFAAAVVARGLNVNAYGTFTAGMVLGPAVCAGLVLFALARVYDRVDLVEDMPR